MNSSVPEHIHQSVQHYYNQLSGSQDLKTDACCTIAAPPEHIKLALSRLHPDVVANYYGCGLVAPQLVGGEQMLDLGCGNGHDVFLAAQFVGEKGHVTGIDMLDKHLTMAKSHQRYHADQASLSKPNTDFIKGHIEFLQRAGVKANSLDVVISNCVINLSPQKQLVFDEIYQALKEGGEFYFSDVYADRRLPPEMLEDEELLGECLSGALYWGDALDMFKLAGFTDPRIVTSRPLTIQNDKLQARIKDYAGDVNFYSATYRLFKISELEPRCEDYGQAVIYKGGIANSEHSFSLDDHHHIERGKLFPVCGNTYNMLKLSRFSDYFDFIGDFEKHYGIFPDCGDAMPFSQTSTNTANTNTPQSCC